MKLPRFRGHGKICVQGAQWASHLSFRRQTVELVRVDRSPEELTREFEPTAQSIRNWFAQSQRNAGCGDGGLMPHCSPRSTRHLRPRAAPMRASCIRSRSASAAGTWQCVPRWVRSATPTTTPWARASSQPSNASCSIAAGSRRRPKPEARYSPSTGRPDVPAIAYLGVAPSQSVDSLRIACEVSALPPRLQTRCRLAHICLRPAI